MSVETIDVYKFQAEEELQTETKRWMRPMIIHQLLEEMVQEYIVGKYRCTVTPDDDKVHTDQGWTFTSRKG